MIVVKTKEEIELMREAALVVSKTLGEVAKAVKERRTEITEEKNARKEAKSSWLFMKFDFQFGKKKSSIFLENLQGHLV